MAPMQEEDWIDYLEGDIDAEIKMERDLILSYSQTDHKILRDYQELRALLVKELTIEMPNDTYFDSLQNKIMSEIHFTAIEVDRKECEPQDHILPWRVPKEPWKLKLTQK